MSDSKITATVNGAVIPAKAWSEAASAFFSATSFGPGSKTWTIPLTAAPRFRFGDVIRYRTLGNEAYMVLTTDPENGDLLGLLALDDGHVYRDRKDPAMWEIVE